MAHDDPRYDPIVQIEAVIEETRKNIDNCDLPYKSSLLLNSFRQIQEQLDNYIKDAKEKLATELNATDLKYWTFAFSFYEKQLEFVKVNIQIMNETKEELESRVGTHVESIKPKCEKLLTIHHSLDGIDEKMEDHKGIRQKLWNSALDIIGRKEEGVVNTDGATR